MAMQVHNVLEAVWELRRPYLLQRGTGEALHRVHISTDARKRASALDIQPQMAQPMEIWPALKLVDLP